jgi:hypothetical protein
MTVWRAPVLLGCLLGWLATLPSTAARADADPAAKAPPSAAAAGPSWVDLADLALASEVVLVATLSSIDRFSRRDAPDVPPDEVRAVVRAELAAALKAPGVLPAEAAWRWQGPADARGRTPFGKEDRVLLFGNPLPGGSNPAVYPLQLVSADGQQPWSAASEAIVRDVLRQALAPGARGLMVTDLRDAFRSEGDVPGASESQFFLKTEGGQPLTLIVRRTPGAVPEVRAASGELLDRAAPVEPRTLLWRALACGMPAALPAALAADAGLAADYALARARLGRCERRLQPPAPAR